MVFTSNIQVLALPFPRQLVTDKGTNCSEQVAESLEENTSHNSYFSLHRVRAVA